MTTLLVDGNNLAYRVFAAYPHLSTSKGKSVSVIYGVIKLLRAAIDKFKPTKIVVAWDGSPTNRRAIYPEYKANRNLNRTPQEEEAYKSYREQLTETLLVLKNMSVHQYREEHTEADDLISVLSSSGGSYTILSEDKDFLQLVSVDVSVYRPIKGEHYTYQNFEQLVGLTPQQFLDARVLQGDSSDNIPGIVGVGEKTAIKLVQQFGDLSGVIKASDTSNKSTILVKIKEGRNLLIRNKMLMNLKYSKDMIGAPALECYIHGLFDEQSLKTVFVKYEFFSFVKSWVEFIAPFRSLS